MRWSAAFPTAAALQKHSADVSGCRRRSTGEKVREKMVRVRMRKTKKCHNYDKFSIAYPSLDFYNVGIRYMSESKGGFFYVSKHSKSKDRHRSRKS